MCRVLLIVILCSLHLETYCWGFFAHRKINELAVFLLPTEMLVLYKPQIEFIIEHAIDPDKRRYAIPQEAPRHYIDIDHYGKYPYPELPRKWSAAVDRFSEDTLNKYGIAPWWIQVMLLRLTDAFRGKQQAAILKLSTELGHYISDAHVPLHTSSNHNGQFTNQKGIHGFWESRIPELLAEKEWDFFIGKARYIADPGAFIWERILESAAASDTVLLYEKQLSASISPDLKYSFELRNGVITRQYSEFFTRAYDTMMKGMVERRMQQSIFAIASFWYTAWVNAGQPDLKKLGSKEFTVAEKAEFDSLKRVVIRDEH